MIDPTLLPTHLATVARRGHAVGAASSADTFLMTSYLVECLIKTIATAVLAGFRKQFPAISHKFEYGLVRADGLGTWETLLGDATSQAFAGYLDADLQPLVVWLTKKRSQPEDDWARLALQRCGDVLKLLGAPDVDVSNRPNLRHLLNQLVRVRNKTKAHGAAGPDFFARANPLFIEATRLLLSNCPVTSWDWYYLFTKPDTNTFAAVHLRGLVPQHLPPNVVEQLRAPIRTIGRC